MIAETSPRGLPRKTDMRVGMNAFLCLLRTGRPWRYLPRDSFPPRSTVYNILSQVPA
jgi:transposase